MQHLRYNDDTSVKRKYKTTELYLLPPALYPSSPLDTVDQRYLDSRYTPIVNHLKPPLRIEFYNDTWLQSSSSNVQTASSIIDQPSIESDNVAIDKHRLTRSFHPPSSSILNDNPTQSSDLSTTLPQFCSPSVHSHRVDVTPAHQINDSVDCTKPATTNVALELTKLANSISSPTSKLVFISYTPVGTMLRRWYLV